VITGNAATRFETVLTPGLVVAQQAQNSPKIYSAELWFKTTSTQGGKLIGFGNATSGLSSSYDRHVYMQSNGRLSFGASSGGQQSLVTPISYNDGQWHHVVATQGSSGMRLWVDSALVGSNSVSGAASYLGYWRVGGDRTWGSTLSNYIAGTLDEVAVYPKVLSEQDVRDHYTAAGRSPLNRPPVAAFTAATDDLEVSLDASASTDPDGPVSYAWNFGDGETGSGETTSHTYAAAGTYQVELTVTDGPGLSDSETKSVTVAANQPPTADFSTTADDLKLAVDAGASTDADGTIADYSWDFGDGSAGSGVADSHTYAESGDYEVELTVTDDDGAKGTVTKTVTVTEPPNVTPEAAFTFDVNDLTVSLDGSGSDDPDGSIEDYAWDFGDDSTGSGETATHRYDESGTYPIRLTVTDDRGDTNTVTHDVTVTAPTVFARDDFDRTMATGWGAADRGGNWTIPTGASRYSVGSGVGKVNLTAGAGTTATLPGVSATETETKVSVSMDKASTGGGSMSACSGARSAASGTTGPRCGCSPRERSHCRWSR
jgi:PKD repeat protein